MGTLSKFGLDLSVIIFVITMISVISTMMYYTTEPKVCSQGDFGLKIYSEYPLTLFTFP